jgi:hypothetical protein
MRPRGFLVRHFARRDTALLKVSEDGGPTTPLPRLRWDGDQTPSPVDQAGQPLCASPSRTRGALVCRDALTRRATRIYSYPHKERFI